MIRAIQIGDFHASPGPRNADRYRALDQIITEATRQDVGLWLWPGDLSHQRQAIEDKNAIADRLIAMGNRAPVVIVYGNHDLPGDLDVFAMLKTTYPIYVVSRPRCLTIEVPHATAWEDAVTIFCLPYPTKAGLVAAGIIPADVGDVASVALEDIFRQAGHELTEARKRHHLTLMVGHVNVGGSIMSAGQPNIGHEIEISARHLDYLGDVYKGLNHIHKGQDIAGAWYPGSVCRLSWGEIEPKRYLEILIGEDPTVVKLTSRYWLRFMAGALDDPAPVTPPPFEWWHLGEREDGRSVIYALIDAADHVAAEGLAVAHWPELHPAPAEIREDDWRPDAERFPPIRTPYLVLAHPIDVAPMYHIEGELAATGFTWAVVDGETPASWAGCEVRVRVTYRQSEKSTLNFELAKAPFVGALRLVSEPVAIPDRAVRAPAVAAATTLPDKIRAWGESVGIETTQPLLDKLARLEHSDAADLVASVRAEIAALVAEEEEARV